MSIKRSTAMMVISVALILSATAFPLDAAPASAQGGGVLADSGFRPAPDGFSFENYGNAPGVTDLTPAEMQALFGNDVCASTTDGVCTLTPVAEQQMNDWNNGMQGGHCAGMSVTALLLFTGFLAPSAFGESTTGALTLAQNQSLQRRIAQSFVYQSLASVDSATIRGTPNQVLEALITRLNQTKAGSRSESWGLGFYKPNMSGGHEVTPFAVVDNGDGIDAIKLYDNNYPGETRELTVNTKTDSWTYNGSTNPKEPSDLYTGNAQTKTLEISPTNPGNNTQPCPFCAVQGPNAPSLTAARLTGSSSSPTREFTLEADPSNHGHLLFTDPQGRQTGYRDGQFVNHIPGAQLIFPKLNIDYGESEEPTYVFPANDPLSIVLDGARLKKASETTFSEIGPAFATSIQGINLKRGERDTFKVPADSPQISFRAGRAQLPTARLEVDESGVDYAVQVASSTPIAARARVVFALHLGSLVIDASNLSTPSTYQGTLTRVNSNGDGPPAAKTFQVGAHGHLTIPFAEWQ